VVRNWNRSKKTDGDEGMRRRSQQDEEEEMERMQKQATATRHSDG